MKMTMKTNIKITGVVSAIVMSVALTACSGSNPLESEPHDKALSFVKTASMSAEKTLHVKAFPPGNTYYNCMTDNGMTDKRQNPHVCEDLYNEMIAYAKTTDGPFKHITLTELQDQKAFRPLYKIPFDHYYN
ncbi:MAG: hypothetical protein LRY67_06575 [Gammaproteobacteria bacterium]|nr:hypothetical protein [Gammaproteobacteria bacterium]MCD8542920.1 hypothetical protein [Gammaproteobacteria bacterium]MCD8573627.1 hypothetical protein [Gammaproteobacteria bacterium]